MAFLCSKPTCCLALAVGFFIGLENGGTAATITQTADYNFADHGTTVDLYQQFDPSLGTLVSVTIEDKGIAYADGVLFANESSVDQTFVGTVTLVFDVGTSQIGVSSTFTQTLTPGGTLGDSVFEGTDGAYDVVSSFGPDPAFVGTYELGPLEFSDHYWDVWGSTDNPNIDVGNLYASFVLDGVETVTYVYQTTPEPSSFVIMAMTCLLVLGSSFRPRACGRGGHLSP
jgi:hypothetical protein